MYEREPQRSITKKKVMRLGAAAVLAVPFAASCEDSSDVCSRLEISRGSTATLISLDEAMIGIGASAQNGMISDIQVVDHALTTYRVDADKSPNTFQYHAVAGGTIDISVVGTEATFRCDPKSS